MAEEAGIPERPWRGIDELARLVGAYGWVEHRIFQLAGVWASAPSEGVAAAPGPELRVWCAAVSRHHGEVASRWAERLPVRAGIDPAALVVAPVGPLAGALHALEAEPDQQAAIAALVETVLPRLELTYVAHLASAVPVCEAPVMDTLAEAQRLLRGEIRGGRALVEGSAAHPEGRRTRGGVRTGV